MEKIRYIYGQLNRSFDSIIKCIIKRFQRGGSLEGSNGWKISCSGPSHKNMDFSKSSVVEEPETSFNLRS